MSHGNSADLSISAARGATRSRARSRTRSRISRCSGLSGSAGTAVSLEKDLECDLRRTTALEQRNRLMQVDLELPCEHLRLEAPAPCPLQLLAAPRHDLLVGDLRLQQLRGRH